MRETIAVFGSSSTMPTAADYGDAMRLGGDLADAGFTVATGGYGGTMEAVSRGAADRGGHVVGVTAPALFPMRDGANAWVAEERPRDTLMQRIDELVGGSAGVVALPGSIGTLAELIVAWNDAAISRLSAQPGRPIVTVGEPWASLVPHLASATATDAAPITVCARVDDVVPALVTSLRSR